MSSLSENTRQSGRLAPGTLLHDRYEVIDFVGAGGFAQVYRCLDRQIDREVAVKVFWPLGQTSHNPDTYQQLLTRFRREASAAAKIRHPNVVNIFDVRILDDSFRPYIVMEYLAGHDLGEELKHNGAMSPTRAIPLFCKVLEALGEAHAAGVVHKDLKPSNLFLSEPGTRYEAIRILDFGVAYMAEDKDSRITKTGHAFGTPGYLAPEYIHKQIVTPQLDVYQMGLILVELLSGQRVVMDDNPLNCVMIHGTCALELPTALLHSDLGPIIVKALSLDYNGRYANGLELADALVKLDPSGLPRLKAGGPRQALQATSGSIRAIMSQTAPPDTGNFRTSPHTVPVDLDAMRRGRRSEVSVEIPGISRGGEFEDEEDATSRSLTTSQLDLEGLEHQSIVESIRSGGLATHTMSAVSMPAKEETPARTGLPLVWLAVGAGALLLMSITVVAVLLLGGEDIAPESEPAPVVAAPTEADQAPVADAAPVEHRVTITSRPPGATIFKDGEMVGLAPYEFTFGADEEVAKFEMALDDHEMRIFELHPSDGPKVELELQRVTAAGAEGADRAVSAPVRPSNPTPAVPRSNPAPKKKDPSKAGNTGGIRIAQ